MSIVVFPLNAGPNTHPSLARQFSNFAQQLVSDGIQTPIDFVTLSIQIPEDGNRIAMVNPAETLNEPEIIMGVFQQREDITRAVDGLLTRREDGSFELKLRCFERLNETPIDEAAAEFPANQCFDAFRLAVKFIAKQAGQSMPAEWESSNDFLGTDQQEALLDFLEGHDAALYINQAGGQVVSAFDPLPPMEKLLRAYEADRDWEAPYASLVMLCRLCTQHRIGAAENAEKMLEKLVEGNPEDMRALFALGELYEAMGEFNKACDAFEKALNATPEDNPDRSVMLTKLGVTQMNAGMPANAERTIRKALELEQAEKPSMGFLADILRATGRQHEVPNEWRSVVEAVPTHPLPWVQLANSLLNDAGNEAEALRTYERGLEHAENNVVVKRYFAPVLLNIARREKQGEKTTEANDMVDRALDLYEDCLDAEPNDVALLMEYVDALVLAGRNFEVPKVLRDILKLTDGRNPNVWSNAQALLIELEQPKRAEAVAEAQQKLEQGDAEGAVKSLRPLKNWLTDYWKLWAVMAQGLLAVDENAEAEEASTRLLNLMPVYEPGYNLLVESLIRQKKSDQAYQIMGQVMPNFTQSLNMAIVYARAARYAGHTEEARNLAQQIRQAASQNQEMLTALTPVLQEIEA